MDVGKNIRVIRTKAGLRQKKLAKMLGVSASYLSQVEGGKRNPSFSFIRSFSERLNVPMGLIFLEDYSKQNGLDPNSQRLLESLQNFLFDIQTRRIKKARTKS